MEAFAYGKFNATGEKKIVLGRVEKIFGKGEKAVNKIFFSFESLLILLPAECCQFRSKQNLSFSCDKISDLSKMKTFVEYKINRTQNCEFL